VFIIILSISSSTLNYNIIKGTYIDDFRKWDVVLGIDSKSIQPKISIISINNTDYIVLTPNLLYPVKDIPNINITDGKSVKILSSEFLNEVRLRFILQYKDNLNSIITFIHKIGGNILHIYKYLPFISVELPIENSTLPIYLGLNVDVSVDHRVHVLLNESVPMIKDPTLWSELEREYGYSINGSGVIIGILDTGIDGHHPDFYFPNGTCKIIINVSMVPDEPPIDYYGHGTHVAGIAAGTGVASHGKFTGVAPGALLANIKVINKEGIGYDSWIIAGIEEAVEDGVDIINLSLGGGMNGDGSDPLSMAVDWAVDNNVVVVVAAGNEGPHYSSLGTPAVAKKAITVGAISKDYKLAEFSSRGPTGDGRPKPEVVAPGVNIIAPLARNSTLSKSLEDYILYGDGGDYIPLSGTSMAAPHVAGLAALIKQVHPDWNASAIRSVIISSADSLGYDVYSEGVGLVNAVKSVEAVVGFTDVNTAIMLNKFYDGSDSKTIGIYNLIGGSHSITSVKLVSKEFFNESMDIDGYLSVSYDGNQLTLQASPSIPYGMYYGRCIISVDNLYNYTILFTVAKTIVLEVNATYGGEYFDTLFMICNVDYPKKWILPHGFKWSYNNETGEYNYTEWFNLIPGKYKLYGVSLNPLMGRKYIPGPVFIYSNILYLVGNRYISMDYKEFKEVNLPYIYGGYTLQPVAHIYGFYTEKYSPIIIYHYGVWNLSDYKLYVKHSTGDPIYFSIQYLAIPDPLLWSNRYRGIDFSTELFIDSWVIFDTPDIIQFNMMSRYEFDSSSTLPGINAFSGFAVFPPGRNYTYIILLPFYQGVKYNVYASLLKPIVPENNSRYEDRYFLTLTKDISISSLTVLDPLYTGRDINPTKPPFYMYTRVSKGVREFRYINVSGMLVSNLDPPTLRGLYRFESDLYYNNTLINHTRDRGIVAPYLFYIRDLGGEYRYIIRGDSDWIFTDSFRVIVDFNTNLTDYEPPLIYDLNYDPIISRDEIHGSITILDSSKLSSVSIHVKWDNKYGVDADLELVREGIIGVYRMYVYSFSIPVLGNVMDLNITVSDEYGNRYSSYYKSSASSDIEVSTPGFNIDISPKYIEPKANSTISIIPGDQNLYGFLIYINDSVVGGMYADRDLESFPGLILNPKTYGSYNIKAVSKPFIYGDSITLNDTLISTILIVKDYLPKYNRVNVATYVTAGFRILHEYDMSPASYAYAIVNGTLYQADEDGYIKFELYRSDVGKVSFRIDGVYTDSDYSKVSIYSVEHEYYNIIFDTVIVEADKTSYRVDVSKEFSMPVYAYYKYDKTPFNGTIIFKSNEKYYSTTSNNGVYNLTITHNVIGLVELYPYSIKDPVYNITVFKSTFDKIDVIFDKVIVNLFTRGPRVVKVGSTVDIQYNAYYAFDGKEFIGKVYITPYPYTSDEPGEVEFTVSSIEDDLYGLTSFESNTLKIFFDSLNISISCTTNLGVYEYIIKVSYLYSGENVSGLISIDGVSHDFRGIYSFEKKSYLPYDTITVSVKVEGFPAYTESFKALNYYNLLLEVVVIIAIGAAVFYIIRRR